MKTLDDLLTLLPLLVPLLLLGLGILGLLMFCRSSFSRLVHRKLAKRLRWITNESAIRHIHSTSRILWMLVQLSEHQEEFLTKLTKHEIANLRRIPSKFDELVSRKQSNGQTGLRLRDLLFFLEEVCRKVMGEGVQEAKLSKLIGEKKWLWEKGPGGYHVEYSLELSPAVLIAGLTTIGSIPDAAAGLNPKSTLVVIMGVLYRVIDVFYYSEPRGEVACEYKLFRLHDGDYGYLIVASEVRFEAYLTISPMSASYLNLRAFEELPDRITLYEMYPSGEEAGSSNIPIPYFSLSYKGSLIFGSDSIGYCDCDCAEWSYAGQRIRAIWLPEGAVIVTHEVAVRSEDISVIA